LGSLAIGSLDFGAGLLPVINDQLPFFNFQFPILSVHEISDDRPANAATHAAA
jgi:hypothetical protein